jgi:hypothetical protein
MNIILIIPKVVRRYLASFPEVRNNAYRYFNYDNRVVDERVHSCECKSPYQGPDDFCDEDYDSLVKYAKTLINPYLARYSASVACDDALEMAIRDFNKGKFDGKINSSRYKTLLGSLKQMLNVPQNPSDNYYKRDNF